MASGGAENPAGWNRYGYVEGDPVNGTDSTGLLIDMPFDPYHQSITVTAKAPLGPDPFISDIFFGLSLRASRDDSENRTIRQSIVDIRNDREFDIEQAGGCAPRFERFFSNAGIYESMAEQLNTKPEFLMALSSYESGWLNDHNHRLNNLFGVTNAGGKNQSYASPQASADYWIRNFGDWVRNAQTIDDFVEGLRYNGANPYNSVNPNYDIHIRQQLLSVQNRITACVPKRPGSGTADD